jgi:xanthine dehydrogenase accessory factor
MTSPYERMADLAAAGQPFALATVVRTHGSTPQVVGAKLVLTADQSRPFGTLGGGCVEADAVLALRDVLANGGRSLREYRLTEELAWNTGLVCGGTMWILAEAGETALECGGRNLTGRAADAARGGAPLALVTRLRRDGRRWAFDGRLAVEGGGDVIGSLGDPAIDARAREAAVAQIQQGPPRLVPAGEAHDLLVDPIVGVPRLVIAGGGHVARAIARQARLLDFDVTVLEDRPEFASPDRFDGATVVHGDVPSSVASADYRGQTYLVIATRGHKLDADCVLAAARTTAPYIGLLGSRRKTVLIEDMLRDAGVDPARLAAIHAPVGLDLGGRTPAEIALSVMAEISQLRHGGSGRPLRAATPPRE